jgi:hypothetical protein
MKPSVGVITYKLYRNCLLGWPAHPQDQWRRATHRTTAATTTTLATVPRGERGAYVPRRRGRSRTELLHRDESTESLDWYDSADRFDWNESADKKDWNDPTDSPDITEPSEPTDATEPIDPTESTEPTEPMESTELSLPMESTERVDARERHDDCPRLSMRPSSHRDR